MNGLWRFVTIAGVISVTAGHGVHALPQDSPVACIVCRTAPATVDRFARPDARPSAAPVMDAVPGAELDLWSFELVDVSSDAAVPAGAGPDRTRAEPHGLTGQDRSDARPDPAILTTAADRTRTAAAMGSSQPAIYQSLIHKPGAQRAAVTSWGIGADTQVWGFSTEPASPSGRGQWDTGAIERYRINGVVAEHALPLGGSDRLTMTGGWVSGTPAADPDGLRPSQRGGSAWSLAGRAALLSDRLGVSFEHAGSERDTLEPDQDSAIGQAFRAGAEWRAASAAGRDWHLGTEYSWVDARFDSVANPSLARDRQRLRMFAGLRHADWSVDLSFNRDRNNLAGDLGLPTTEGAKAQIVTAWRPAATGIQELLGAPSFKLTADVGRQRVEDAGCADDAAVSSERTTRLRFESLFKAAHWQWGIDATGSESPGSIDAVDADGIQTARLDLHSNFAFAGGLPAKPALSWQRRRDLATGARDEKWRAEVRSGMFDVDDDLRADLGIGYLQRLALDRGEREAAVKIGGRLLWTLQPATSQRNGLALAVTGDYIGGHGELVSADGRDDIRLMLSLSTTSPLGAR